MKIQLDKIIPFPFSDGNYDSHSLWGKETEITGKRVLVQAVSGKGKSTFVNSIYGIRKDFSGVIYFDQQPTNGFTSNQWSEIRKTRLSVVFQDLQLIPHLTVGENLALKNSLTNNTGESLQKEYVEKVGLLDKWNVPTGILSYGQQQRIAIIRALLQPFEIILLDEPFAHLDNTNANICYQLIVDKAIGNEAAILLTTLNHTDIDNFDQHLIL